MNLSGVAAPRAWVKRAGWVKLVKWAQSSVALAPGSSCVGSLPGRDRRTHPARPQPLAASAGQRPPVGWWVGVGFVHHARSRPSTQHNVPGALSAGRVHSMMRILAEHCQPGAAPAGGRFTSHVQPSAKGCLPCLPHPSAATPVSLPPQPAVAHGPGRTDGTARGTAAVHVVSELTLTIACSWQQAAAT